MAEKKKIAIILSGCGVYDGSEIHEAALTMLAICRAGAVYEVFAPDIRQAHVVNHLTGETSDEERNVLVESARIARGNISNLKNYMADNFDGLILPGGFGAAKNLSTFAFDGPGMTVNPDVEAAIEATVKAGKPIGALCIAPVIIAKLLKGATVTIGSDADTINGIITLGGKHETSIHGEIVIDPDYKVITTPCYMLDADIGQIYEGVVNLVDELLKNINRD